MAETARLMLADHKGLLAMDESNGTCNKRFAKAGIEETEEARRRYRELIVTTPGLGNASAASFFTTRRSDRRGRTGRPSSRSLPTSGIIPGIKVDVGAKDLAGHAGEKITEGLDGLRERLRDYFQMGARFAKWRAVIGLGDGLPAAPASTPMRTRSPATPPFVRRSASFPIVEPEVLMDGDHTLARCLKRPSASCAPFSNNWPFKAWRSRG